MFTINQIKEAHSKVKSGADFPTYVQDISKLGITGYETHVTDSHAQFFGKEGYSIKSEAKYPVLEIADKSNSAQFQKDLKAHQQGKTDYLIFCRDCATSGIEKWVVDIKKMTCTYYDKAGIEMLEETIPTR